MRRLVLPALLLALALSLCGCWGSELPEEARGGDFWAMEQPMPEEPAAAAEPERFTLPYLKSQTLDPIACSDGVQQVIGSLLYEGLFRLNDAFEPEPVLCASYQVSANGLTYTFALRQDAVFSNGDAVSSNDVLAAYRRAKTSERYSARFSNIVSMRASKGAVVLTLRRPDSALPALLDIPVVKAGTEKDSVPLGTGPYLFMTDSEGPCLVRVQGRTGGPERIALALAKDMDAAVYLYSARSVHLLTADLLSGSSAAGLTDAEVTDHPTGTLLFLGFNTLREPLNNVDFRAALGLGFDREVIATTLLSGHARAAQFPISPASGLYPAEMERAYENNAYAEALEALGTEGQETVELTLLVNSENAFKTGLAEYLARELSAAWVRVTPRELPWMEYVAALEAGDFDLWLGEVRLTPDWDASVLLGSGGALNYSGGVNPDMDAALSAFLANETPETAAEYCARVSENTPILPLAFKNLSTLRAKEYADYLPET